MKEHPIIFSGAMIRAILAGTKSQTRRIVKLRGGADVVVQDGKVWKPARVDYAGYVDCPYGQPGDRIWVRETHCLIFPQDPCYNGGKPIEIDYRASPTERMCDHMGLRRWTPAIHMRREYSRITLEVTGVRVERLQEISDVDAKAEGIMDWYSRTTNPVSFGINEEGVGFGVGGSWKFPATRKEAYERLWDHINAKRAPWASNPWVWVIEFKRVAA